MPLSEDEQRILQEIEAQFYANDPQLAQQVSETTLYRHASRNIKWAALGFVVGFVVLLTSFASSLFFGFVGFLAMLGLRLRGRGQRPEDGEGRSREHHRLGEGQAAEEPLRRRREELPQALPQRRQRQLAYAR